MKKCVLTIILFLTTFSTSFSCTTFIITKGASQDGSILIGHTDDIDSLVGDSRIVHIPAKNHPENSKRAVYSHENYPREVEKKRAFFEHATSEEKSSLLGYIDEVNHTFAYIEGFYGIMNEHQLAMGECTDATKFYFEADPKNRIIDITTLMLVGLERCKTAKEAILVMGEIAEKYGFYGLGETLPIADKDEAWVFEISCPPNGEGAIWVAKKIPDGEVFVAANQFRIQEIDPNSQNFLFSKNLFKIAKDQHWLDEKGRLNWQKSISLGEFDHPYYSLRRVWRFQSLIAPSQHLNPYVESAYTTDYPFSIQPDKPLSLETAMNLFRDHYEGTQFDLTKGKTAGPYGNPHRYLGNYDKRDLTSRKVESPLKGAWERSISVYFTGYSYIAQVRPNFPDEIGAILWLGMAEPATCCYMPIYSSVMSLPSSLEKGDSKKFDRNFAWWPFNLVNNWISNSYRYAVKDVLEKQQNFEKQEREKIASIDARALRLYKIHPKLAKNYLTNISIESVNRVVKEWWKLSEHIIEKYPVGYINLPNTSRVGYPENWLDDVEYRNGPTSYLEKK